LAVKVTVSTVAENDGTPETEFSLVRWMVDPALGLAICTATTLALGLVAWVMFRRGYRLKA
jgi:hypothetical protein